MERRILPRVTDADASPLATESTTCAVAFAVEFIWLCCFTPPLQLLPLPLLLLLLHSATVVAMTAAAAAAPAVVPISMPPFTEVMVIAPLAPVPPHVAFSADDVELPSAFRLLQRRWRWRRRRRWAHSQQQNTGDIRS